MLTRADYMANSSELHQQYYLEIAQEAGLTAGNLPRDIATIREKLKTDPHLNNIPLIEWDARVPMTNAPAKWYQAFKARGDYMTLAGGGCTLKALARHLAEQPADSPA